MIDLFIAFSIGFATGAWVGLVLTCVMALRGMSDRREEGEHEERQRKEGSCAGHLQQRD